jgi:hypothetical protein
MAAIEVNHAQAASAKPGAVFDEYPLIVRTTVNDGAAHSPNREVVDRAVIFGSDNSSDSAHRQVDLTV